ncbi:MAG: dihydropteroate synthase-like protein [Promethearchaeota archaeon]
MNILIITGQQSYSSVSKIVKSVIEHNIDVYKAPISISAFLTKNITKEILKSLNLLKYNLILLPGFVQWDTTELEKQFSVNIKKGPEFAADIPNILKNFHKIELSNTIPANKLMEISGDELFRKVLYKNIEIAKKNICQHTFYINEKSSAIMVGRGIAPPIIAEVVNCTKKSDQEIIKKVSHYIQSGADIIDIGCIANKPDPKRVKEIIELIRNNYNILISIDSMQKDEISVAIKSDIDLILSFDLGNYREFLNIPKDIPIVLLPTIVKEGVFPKDPESRVNNLIMLTKKMQQHGFTKLIADPLLETPISPGICKSLETYFLYKKTVSQPENLNLELPLFFGISNVVELMDIDSVGINGLLASVAIELDMGILFTVEHSTKLMGGVSELHECIKLNYISKHNNTPPINQGISIFKAKGKISQDVTEIDERSAILVNTLNTAYIPDEKGYFRIYVNHYSKKIYILFFSNHNELINTFVGTNAEALSKKIIQLNLTDDMYHLNYLGRELNKAEYSLDSGKPYIQDV